MSKSTTSYRSVRKSHFTQVSNDLLNDNSLPLEAKGLLSIFLSNNDEWDLHMSEIIKRSKNGRDAHYNALKKLIKAGYIARLQYKQMNNNQFLHLEYIFSDNKEDVVNGIKEAQKIASQNEQNIVLTYKDIENHLVESTFNFIDKNPYTENQDTENTNTETQYINNTNNNNTNNNNTKDNNDMNDMNDREEEINKKDIQTNHTNHSSHNSITDDEAIKDYYLNSEALEVLPKIKGILSSFKGTDIKIILDTLWKALSSFEKDCEESNLDKGYFAIEDIEDEIEGVLRRFKGALHVKKENVQSMQKYLMTSLKRALEKQRDILKSEVNYEVMNNWLEQ